MSAFAWAYLSTGWLPTWAQIDVTTISMPALVLGALLLAAFAFAAGYWFRAGTPRQPTAASGGFDAVGLPEELVVVIAAAVADSIGEAHRIVRIRGLMPEDLGWQLEGRMQHHASHHPHRHS